MNKNIPVNVGDIIETGDGQHVIVQVLPFVNAAALRINPETNKQYLGLPGTIESRVRKVGEMALSEIVLGYEANLGPLSEVNKNEILDQLKLEQDKGPVELPVL